MDTIPQVDNRVESFYRDRPVLITGGNGFLGSIVDRIMYSMGAYAFAINREYNDLTDVFETSRAFGHFDDMIEREGLKKKPIVFHFAAVISGIASTSSSPVEHLENNVIMATNVIRETFLSNIGYIVAAGSVCAYPERTPIKMNEKNLWNGKPEPSNFSYGISKRYILALLDAYLQERLIDNFAYLISANLYGPGDNFNPRTSHVIPALILKADRARKENKPLEVWGTGRATRDFLYALDAAMAYVNAGYAIANREEPVICNIGSGDEISISALAKMIADSFGIEGIVYDTTKPDGQPRRCLDISLAKELLDWEPSVNIREGLKRTIEYFDYHIRFNFR